MRPLGFKGSNPLQGIKVPLCILAFFVHASQQRGKGARVHARSSAHGRASPSPHRCSPSFVALRLLLFQGCNKIFYQKQNGITAPNMEDHQEVDHQ